MPEGYPLEEHFVTTSDGFVLRLFRIKHGRRGDDAGDGGDGDGCGDEGDGSSAVVDDSGGADLSSSSSGGGGVGSSSSNGKRRRRNRRPVAHLQHGLLGASSDWALNGAAGGLAFILADAGFDVWLGNVRANYYSRNHTSLTPADASFWAFTWDDIAAKDLPAMLSHELAVTGAESLAYVGHSQGTTVLLALLASRPDWAPRISAAALLAPVAFARHIASPVLVALARLDTDALFALLGVNEFLPSSEALSRLDGRFCRAQPRVSGCAWGCLGEGG